LRLKKIQIRGFKTFADTTEIEFTPGITAVVGPNGSGKSNISDAIAWVMGETNVRNLRATRTEDVIFNGSAARKPVGLAEVTLTLDNSSGRLPIGFSEVTITRRAFRSGDSEYFINKVPCRLRDIYELFLDSGAGGGAYSMISQGEVDALLTGKPEDRRELLEEAAGVKKYRHRRNETCRKLEHTRENLSRVDDIMNELQAQMEPLAEQAEKAIRYRELTTRLREIEVGLLVSRVQTLNGEIEGWRSRDGELRDELAALERRIIEQTQEEERCSESARKAREELEAAHETLSRAQSRAERLRSDLALAQARRQSAEETRRRLTLEIASLSSRLQELEERSSRSGEELQDVLARRSTLEEEVRRAREMSDGVAAKLAECEEELARHESGARGLAEDKAAQRSRLESCRARMRQLEEEAAALLRRQEELEERRGQRSAEAGEATAAAAGLEERLRTLDRELEQARSAAERLAASLRDESARLEEITREHLEQSSRLKTLKQMQEAGEGLYAGVRAVLAASRQGRLRPGYAMVADVLEVPGHLDQAIEAALGGALQDIAVRDFSLVREAIEYLKQGGHGRATFLPMDRLERPEVLSAQRLRGEKGIVGCAYDLVGFAPEYEPVARLLLGRVLVAEDLDSAAEAARRMRGWSKIVTLDGELLLPSGAVTGGSRPRRGPGLTERRREIAALEESVRELERRRRECEARVADLKEHLERETHRTGELQKEAGEARLALTRIAGARDAAANALRELEDSSRELAGRLEACSRAHQQTQDEIRMLEAMLSDSDAAGDELEALLEARRSEVAALRAEAAAAMRSLQETAAELSAVSERERALKQAGAALEEDLNRTRSLLEERKRELEAGGDAGERDALELEELAARADEAAAEMEARQVELMQAQSRAQELLNALDGASRALRESRERSAALASELHELELALARGEAEMAQMLERLWDEYEITRNDALTWPEPLLVKHGTAAEVARLRREIRAMGEVNTGAVAEFERVRERWEFLASQRADLEEAERDLLQAIREIDDSTRGLFMETFERVQEHFAEVFTLLFGGGVARLELTQPENLLETGVEVFVQPPGKTLQNMNLLSGGEKALTAQALLFALMRVKPSPFCVLDEVDAPLDDANVVRFAELVRQYARDSQFIVITHNRATMEAADVLYGVTMREPGISSLYSAKLSDV
jgi:chromosome segregation protein